MRRGLLVVGSLALCATLFYVVSSEQEPSAWSPFGGIFDTTNAGERILLPAQGEPEKGTEILRGSRAWERLNELERNPRKAAGFQKAARSLQRRGFVPTTTVFAARSVRVQLGDVVPVSQETIWSSSEGEIVWWAWDDGDPTTWEGVLYVTAFIDGASTTFTIQIDVSESETQPASPVFLDPEDFEPGGDEGGGGGGGPLPGEPVASRPGPAATTVAYSQGCCLPIGAALFWTAMEDELDDFLVCSFAAAGGVASACALSTGAWPACFAPWAIGGVVTCGILNLVDAYRGAP